MLDRLPSRMNPVLGFDDIFMLFTTLKGLGLILSIALSLLGVITLILRILGQTSNMLFQTGHFIFRTLVKIIRMIFGIVLYPIRYLINRSRTNSHYNNEYDDDDYPQQKE